MSSRRKNHTVEYATPQQMSVLQKFDRFRWLFWPVGAVIFLGVFLALAGDGAAAGIYELVVHLPLLGAWLISAFGWGVLLSLVGRTLLSVVLSSVFSGTASSAMPGQEQTGMSVPPKDERQQDDRQECPSYHKTAFGVVTTIAVGLGFMSLATLGLGLMGAMNRPVAIAMVVAGVVIAVLKIVRAKPKATADVDFVHWPVLLLVPLAAMVVLCALLPAGLLWGMDEPNGYDVVGYHLQVPREWYEAERISGLHHNVYSYFPFNVEMHYLLAMHVMGGPWKAQFLAQLMHAAYMGLTVAAVYGVASRWGRGRGIIAALLAAAPPWMPMLGAIAYNEGGLLLYGTLAVGWVLNAERRTLNAERGEEVAVQRSAFSIQRFALSGLLAGLAAGCKLTAVPLLLVGIPVAVLIVNWRQWKGVAVFVIAALLTFSPWLIRNAVWTGNPVFPEMQSVLGRGHFSEEQSARWHRAHKPRPDQQAMTVRVAELGRQVFADARFAYVVLPLGVVAMLLAIRRREARLLLILLLILTAFWLLQTHLQGRFYVLAIPIAAIAVALAADGKWLVLTGSLATMILLLGFGVTFDRLWGIESDFRKSGIQLMQAVGSQMIDNSAAIWEHRKGNNTLPVVLVGDAKAFFYQLSMSRLHYRTVFDVDTSNGRPLSQAYTADLPEGTRVILWVDSAELARFRKTYQLPDADQPLISLGMYPPYALEHIVTKSPDSLSPTTRASELSR